MERLITPRPAPSANVPAGRDDADKALARLIKYIPGEIISGYMAFAGLADVVSKTPGVREFASWGVFAFGVALTPIYLWKVGHPKGVQWWHLPISTVAFVLWAYALGGPFKLGAPFMDKYPYESSVAALVAGVFSWAVAAFWEPTDSSA